MTNVLSHSYHLGDSTFIFMGIRSNFSFLFHFSNRIAPDETPRFAPPHLGLFCLPITHIKRTSCLYELKACTEYIPVVIALFVCFVALHPW